MTQPELRTKRLSPRSDRRSMLGQTAMPNGCISETDALDLQSEIPHAFISVRQNPHLRTEHVVATEDDVVQPSDFTQPCQPHRHFQLRRPSR